MERAKTFQDMLKESTLSATEPALATGIAMVVIGILAILAPLASGVVFDMFFGALLIGAGIVELIDAFRAETWQRGVLFALAGIITLAAGVLYIARPVVGLVALTVVFIAYLIFLGAFRIVMAFQLPRGSPGKVWGFVSGVARGGSRTSGGSPKRQAGIGTPSRRQGAHQAREGREGAPRRRREVPPSIQLTWRRTGGRPARSAIDFHHHLLQFGNGGSKVR